MTTAVVTILLITPLRTGQLSFCAVILPATFDIALILDLAVLTASSTPTLIVAAIVVMMVVTVMLERLIGGISLGNGGRTTA